MDIFLQMHKFLYEFYKYIFSWIFKDVDLDDKNGFRIGYDDSRWNTFYEHDTEEKRHHKFCTHHGFRKTITF